MMCLLICCDDLSVCFDLKSTRRTICQKISIVCFSFLNRICTVWQCLVFRFCNVSTNFIVVISLDHGDHLTWLELLQCSGIRKNRQCRYISDRELDVIEMGCPQRIVCFASDCLGRIDFSFLMSSFAALVSAVQIIISVDTVQFCQFQIFFEHSDIAADHLLQ